MSGDTSNSKLEIFVKGVINFLQLIGNGISACCDWYVKHADTIEQYIQAFSNLAFWNAAVDELVKCQIIFTDDLSDELISEINTADNVDAVVESYYFGDSGNRVNEIISRCQRYLLSTSYSALFSQIQTSYETQHYHLACIGMFAILDGVFSDVSGNARTKTSTRFEAIETKITERLELNELDRRTICICKTMSSFEQTIFKDNYSFDDEPTGLNRHWVMHGRTRREYSRYDFLKVLLWLDAIAFLEGKLAENV